MAGVHAFNLVRGVVAVAERGGSFLMIQRAPGVAVPGAWCFPGGGIRNRETPSEAIRREMLEELSLPVKPVRRLWEWQREDGSLHLEWWQVTLGATLPCPNPAEVQDYRWMTPDQIRTHPGVLPNNISFLDFYRPA
jgi:8-oxo-dGTP pyrophosphatase MutT (NUDIX family)